MAAEACADAIIRRGRDWAAGFTRRAAATELRGEARGGVSEVVSLLSAAVAAHGLPVPTTQTYVEGWVSLISSAHTYLTSVQPHGNAANPTPGRPLTLMTTAADRARPSYELDESLTLSGCLAVTPSATELLVASLATPDSLHAWADFSEAAWQVEPAIRDAAAHARIDRTPLLDAAFTALSRADRVTNQRVVAEVLKGLDPSPAEVRDRVALILHVLPTVHGSVTNALLGMALAADLLDDDLIELGTIILARPEKAQKTTLVAHVAASNGGAREPLLTLAAGGDDAALAAKARMALAPAGTPRSALDQPPRITGLPPWSRPIEPFRPEPFEPYDASEAALDRARTDEQTWSRITTEAAYLDLVVRFAHRDLDRLRSLVSASPEPDGYSLVRTPYLLHQWVTTGDARRPYRPTGTSDRRADAAETPVAEHPPASLLPPAHLHFTDRLVQETLLRLGPLTELLSTPSRSDGTLEVAVLADRVARARSVGYGPYDLVQALLRLGPTDPHDTGLFDGLTLRPAGQSPAFRSAASEPHVTERVTDGVDVIRAWVASGAWVARRVDFPTLEPRSSPLVLPLPGWLSALDGIDGMCAPADTRDELHRSWGSDEPGPWLGACPWDVENLAVMIASRSDQDSVAHAQRLPLLVCSAGPIGPAVHHHLARLLVHPRLDSRLLAAQQVAALALRGRVDPQLLRERSLALFAHGALPLSRAAQGWAELAALSSMDTIWPTWIAVLDAACSGTRKPAGLADLVRVTREHAPAVVDHLGREWLPASVQLLAKARGASKAATEARALVAALREGGGSGPTSSAPRPSLRPTGRGCRFSSRPDWD